MAEQLTTERRVALKMLARYADDVSVERLLAEARVTSRIVSDHIVQVIDAGVDSAEGDVFVVMELLYGTTLDDRVMDHGPLSAAETADFTRQIAVGLDKAHGHVDPSGRATPIIHRDLKPSNVFITHRDDGRPLLKILDFGAAKVLSQTTKTSGVVRGTPQFMACEQALGEPSTVGTDIWALGLIAFYLLTSRSYWLTVENNGTEAQLFAELLNLPLPPASARARQLGAEVRLSPAFDAWFSRCVNRDRAQRFTSAGAAAAELARALGVTTDLARVTAPPTQAPVERAARRSPAARPLETQDLAVLSSSTDTARSNRGRITVITLGIALAASAGAAAVVLSQHSARRNATTPSSSASAVSTRPTAAVAPSNAAAVSTPSSAPATSTPSVAASSASLPRPLRPKPPTQKGHVDVHPSRPAEAARDPYEQR